MTPDFTDWLAYGLKRFGVAKAPTTEEAPRLANPQEEMLCYVYACIARYGETGIAHGKLSGICRRIDRTRRDTLLTDLVVSGYVRKVVYKMPRGPASVMYVAQKPPTGYTAT